MIITTVIYFWVRALIAKIEVAKKSEHERNRKRQEISVSTYTSHIHMPYAHALPDRVFLSLVSLALTIKMPLFRTHISTMLMLFHIFAHVVVVCSPPFSFFSLSFGYFADPLISVIFSRHIFSVDLFSLVRDTRELFFLWNKLRMVEKENRCQTDSINNNNGSTQRTNIEKEQTKNDEMDEKYEIRAQMFKMRAIMWCFHSSLHANLLYDLFASKYLFTLAAATVFATSPLPPNCSPVFIITVSHWIFHLSHRIRIFVMSSFFFLCRLAAVCVKLSFLTMSFTSIWLWVSMRMR